jgi:hypothetical protein
MERNEDRENDIMRSFFRCMLFTNIIRMIEGKGKGEVGMLTLTKIINNFVDPSMARRIILRVILEG